MRFTVCESTNPPIKELLERHFILWYSNVDNYTEWYPYAADLGGFTLPLIAVIDVFDDSVYLDRTTGVQYPADFYERLQAYIQGDINGQCGSDPGDPNSKCITMLPILMLLLE